jgi:hypothetical protein
MIGMNKVVAARIKETVPRAVYIHCRAHKLNLALENAFKQMAESITCLGTVEKMHCTIS